jgi:hypothetical protein
MLSPAELLLLLTARVKSPITAGSQGKAPAPRLQINNLRDQVGRASACQDFRHRLLSKNRLLADRRKETKHCSRHSNGRQCWSLKTSLAY